METFYKFSHYVINRVTVMKAGVISSYEKNRNKGECDEKIFPNTF